MHQQAGRGQPRPALSLVPILAATTHRGQSWTARAGPKKNRVHGQKIGLPPLSPPG
jgi:hypothetical protein